MLTLLYDKIFHGIYVSFISTMGCYGYIFWISMGILLYTQTIFTNKR